MYMRRNGASRFLFIEDYMRSNDKSLVSKRLKAFAIFAGLTLSMSLLSGGYVAAEVIVAGMGDTEPPEVSRTMR